MSVEHGHVVHEHHEETAWIDTWWPLLVICFGLTFILTLALFHPYH